MAIQCNFPPEESGHATCGGLRPRTAPSFYTAFEFYASIESPPEQRGLASRLFGHQR